MKPVIAAVISALGRRRHSNNRRWRSTLALLLAFTALPVNYVQAEVKAPTGQINSLQQLINQLVGKNPQLKARKLAWQSTLEELPQATALDDPRLQLTESIDPVETRLGPQDRVLALNQKIPYPGKLGLKGEVVKSDIEIARLEYDQFSREQIVALKQSYYELAYLDEAIRLTLANKSVLEKINRLAGADYALDAATLNDVAKAQSQYAQLSYDVQLLQELRATEKTRINTLLDRDPEFAFEIQPLPSKAIPFKQQLEQLYRWAENSESLLIAEQRIRQSEIRRKLARLQARPDFDLGVRYTQIGESSISGLERSGDDALAVSLGITIPLNRDKNRAIRHQANLNRQQQIEQKKAILNQLRNRIKSVYFKLVNAERQVTLYQKKLIPQARRAMASAESTYRQNNGSISQYLETQSTWLNFQLAQQRALADFRKNRAEMEKLTGQTL